MPKFNALEASFKAAAVSGIFMVWYKLTIEAFKFSWHIITTSPEKETFESVVKLVCQHCGEFYFDNEERHVLDGVLLCDFCRLNK